MLVDSDANLQHAETTFSSYYSRHEIIWVQRIDNACKLLKTVQLMQTSGTGMKSLQSFGVSANELRIVGGGSKNPLWRQIIADSFQLPLRFPTEPESAALGGALQAAAVYNNASVAEFILENEPALSDDVILSAHFTHGLSRPSCVCLAQWHFGLTHLCHKLCLMFE